MRCLPRMPQAGVVVNGRGSDKVCLSGSTRAVGGALASHTRRGCITKQKQSMQDLFYVVHVVFYHSRWQTCFFLMQFVEIFHSNFLFLRSGPPRHPDGWD